MLVVGDFSQDSLDFSQNHGFFGEGVGKGLFCLCFRSTFAASKKQESSVILQGVLETPSYIYYIMNTQIMRVVQQGETFAVQSQKSENGQMMKCNIVLQEMGGKYENQYAAAMLGNMAQCKYAPGELVAVTLRFTTHEHNGQVYQDILVTDIEKVKG